MSDDRVWFVAERFEQLRDLLFEFGYALDPGPRDPNEWNELHYEDPPTGVVRLKGVRLRDLQDEDSDFDPEITFSIEELWSFGLCRQRPIGARLLPRPVQLPRPLPRHRPALGFRPGAASRSALPPASPRPWPGASSPQRTDQPSGRVAGIRKVERGAQSSLP